MCAEYFSDRELGPRPRDSETIGKGAWGGIVSIIGSYITNGGFGVTFPKQCPDGPAVIGTDIDAMGLRVRAEIPGIRWPLDPSSTPDTLHILDLVEFCYRNVAQPKHRDYHGFYNHHHLDLFSKKGRRQFRSHVNTVFARNGLAYELDDEGVARRLAPPVLRDQLAKPLIQSGDDKLDELLEDARDKFLSPDPKIRREGSRCLWDSLERIKSLRAKDKKKSVTDLLAAASAEPEFRAILDADMRSLTDIGNQFHIRHSEASQIELESSEAVDYLFHRLYALMWLLLTASD